MVNLHILIQIDLLILVLQQKIELSRFKYLLLFLETEVFYTSKSTRLTSDVMALILVPNKFTDEERDILIFIYFYYKTLFNYIIFIERLAKAITNILVSSKIQIRTEEKLVYPNLILIFKDLFNVANRFQIIKTPNNLNDFVSFFLATLIIKSFSLENRISVLNTNKTSDSLDL